MKISRVLAAAFSCLIVASCTKPAPDVENATAPGSESAIAPGGVQSSVFVYNAYTASEAKPAGSTLVPSKSFKADQAVNVVVVLRGQAAEAEVKAELSNSGSSALGSEEATIAVNGDGTANLNIAKPAKLIPGSYKVLVSLDGKPSWELDFDVVQ